MSACKIRIGDTVILKDERVMGKIKGFSENNAGTVKLYDIDAVLKSKTNKVIWEFSICLKREDFVKIGV